MKPKEVIDRLVGSSLQEVDRRDYTWRLAFSNATTVATESLWRLVLGQRIVVTSEDDGQLFGLQAPVDAREILRSEMIGQQVMHVSMQESTGDLKIDFGAGVLELLQPSGGYEAWRLSSEGAEIICTGGGGITMFPDVRPSGGNQSP